MEKTQTIIFKERPHIIGSYAIVGPKEGKGALKNYFDYIMKDDLFGEKTYEKAERKMIEQAVMGAVVNSKINPIHCLHGHDCLISASNIAVAPSGFLIFKNLISSLNIPFKIFFQITVRFIITQ